MIELMHADLISHPRRRNLRQLHIPPVYDDRPSATISGPFCLRRTASTPRISAMAAERGENSFPWKDRKRQKKKTIYTEKRKVPSARHSDKPVLGLRADVEGNKRKRRRRLSGKGRQKGKKGGWKARSRGNFNNYGSISSYFKQQQQKSLPIVQEKKRAKERKGKRRKRCFLKKERLPWEPACLQFVNAEQKEKNEGWWNRCAPAARSGDRVAVGKPQIDSVW